MKTFYLKKAGLWIPGHFSLLSYLRKMFITLLLLPGIVNFTFARDNELLSGENAELGTSNPKMRKAMLRDLLKRAYAYDMANKIDSAIIAYEKVLQIDTTLNKVNFEIGRLWNKLGSETVDTAKFEKSIRYFEKYLSDFKIKSKKNPNGEKDSASYFETSQYITEIKEKNLSLIEQFRNFNQYDSLLKGYDGLWISYFFSKKRMVPQWIFYIKRDSISKTLSVELHPSSHRFSQETPNQKVFPILLENGALAFRLTKQQTFKPSQSEYYLKHLMIDLSNPTYPLAIKNASGKEIPYDQLPDDYIEQQKERDAKLHAALEEQLKREISKARIEKTEEEFIIKSASESMINATCREIIANPENKIGGVKVDTINCVFYKIPDELTFIILGRSNIRCANKQHSKEALKNVGFTKWNNWSVTGNVFKHTGYIVLCGGLIIANGYLGGGALALETYRLGVQLLGGYITSAGDEKLMRNPAKWNSKMYNMLLGYYNPEDKLTLESPVKKVEKEPKKKRTKKEKN